MHLHECVCVCDIFVRTTCTDDTRKSRSVFAKSSHCLCVCACVCVYVCDLLERTTFPDSCLVWPHMLTTLACRCRHKLTRYLQQILILCLWWYWITWIYTRSWIFTTHMYLNLQYFKFWLYVLHFNMGFSSEITVKVLPLPWIKLRVTLANKCPNDKLLKMHEKHNDSCRECRQQYLLWLWVICKIISTCLMSIWRNMPGFHQSASLVEQLSTNCWDETFAFQNYYASSQTLYLWRVHLWYHRHRC